MARPLLLALVLCSACASPPDGVRVETDQALIFGPAIATRTDSGLDVIPDPPELEQAEWLQAQGYVYSHFDVDSVMTREVWEMSGTGPTAGVWGNSVFRR